MSTFTGPEIAALAETKCLIASSPSFNDQINQMGSAMQEAIGADNWLNSLYLITCTYPDVKLPIQLQDQDQVHRLLEIIDYDEELKLYIRGRSFKLLAEESLQGVDNLRQGLLQLQAPCVLVFQDMDPSCVEDCIAAVNLTRPIHSLPSSQKEYLNEVIKSFGLQDKDLNITSFIGGPCERDTISSAILLGGNEGYQIFEALPKALEAAASLLSDSHFGILPGQIVKLHGLANQAYSNRQGMALFWDSLKQRWAVNLFPNDERKLIKSENLLVVDPDAPKIQIYVFWGNAVWKRSQLLGEIAKGSWGMCKSTLQDIVSRQREQVVNRLLYAPESEMSNQAEEEMNVTRRIFRIVG
jgi:hypothetical protein